MKNKVKKAKWRCEIPGCRKHKAKNTNVCARHFKEEMQQLARKTK